MFKDRKEMLAHAIALSARQHVNQRDKAGEPYILHVLRVMFQLEDDRLRTIACLHDLIEDCGVSLDDLRREGYPDDVLLAVDALSRREAPGNKESYTTYIDRLMDNPLACLVKLADLRDNSDIRRMGTLPDEAETDFINRYVKTYRKILKHMKGGPATTA